MARAQTERNGEPVVAGEPADALSQALAAAEASQESTEQAQASAEAAVEAALPAELLALLQALADQARQASVELVQEQAQGQTAAGEAPPAAEGEAVAATPATPTDRAGESDRAEAILEAYQSVIDQLPPELVLAQAQAQAAGASTGAGAAAGGAAAAAGVSTGAMLAGLLGLVALGAGGGGGGGGTVAPTTDITLHDGYIDGADVYVDSNDSGTIDAGDKLLGKTVNGKLTATLTDADKLHSLIAQGGTDISTGSAFVGSFSTTAGSAVINPLTTLVQTLVQTTLSELGTLSAADKAAALESAKSTALITVSTALGIETDVDLTKIDTVKASAGGGDSTLGVAATDAIELHSKALMVANMISVGAATLAGAAGEATKTAELSKFVVQGIVSSINTAASSGQAVSFKTADAVTQILNTAVDAAKTSTSFTLDDAVVSSATSNVAGAVAATNQLINAFAGEAAKAVTSAPTNAGAATSGLTQMLQAQKVVMNQVEGLKTANTGTLTQLSTLADVTEVLSQARQVTDGLKVGTTAVTAVTQAPSDTDPPTVTSVEVRPARAGDLAQIVVKMSETVLVKGDLPTLQIVTSAADAASPTTADARYEPGLSFGDTLVFTHRVQPTDVRVAVVNTTSITLPGSASIKDLAGNNATASIATGASANVDGKAPVVTISSDAAFVKAGSAATVTFTVDEAVSSRAAGAFTADDVTVKNGTLSDFKRSSTDPNVFTAKVATTSATAPAEIAVAGGKFTDVAGNANLPSNVVLVSQEGAAPSVSISADKNFFNTVNTVGEPSTKLTFSLSGASTDFTESDITISGGGTLSGFTEKSATVYEATLTGVTSMTQVKVAKDAFVTGTSTAKNVESNTLSFKVDTTKPTVAIEVARIGADGKVGAALAEGATLKAGEPARVTFTVSEEVRGFGPQSLKVTGGFLEGFAQDKTDPTKFTATFKPAAAQPGQLGAVDVGISVPAGRLTDTLGNPNDVAQAVAFKVDNVRPFVTGVTDNVAAVANVATDVVYTYTFAKPVSGLESTDFTVTNGTVKSVAAVSEQSGAATQWSVTVSPKADVASGNIGLTLKADAVTDSVGNTNLQHTQSLQVLDSLAPTASLELNRSTYLKASANNGTPMTGELTIKFSEAVSSLPSSAFSVSGAGGTVGTPTVVAGSNGREWKATFTPAASDSAAEVKVQLAANSYADAAGNTGAAAESAVVRTNVVAPVLTISAAKTVLKPSESTTVTFKFSEPVKDFVKADVNFNGGSLGDLTKVSDSEWTAPFTPTASTSPTTAQISVADNSFASISDSINGVGQTITLKANQTNPTLNIAFEGTQPGGIMVYGIEASDTTVQGLAASDFTTSNGEVVAGSFAPATNAQNQLIPGKYTVQIKPSVTGEVVVSAAEGAGSTDLPTLAAQSTAIRAVLGTNANDTLALTNAKEIVFLDVGSGDDVVVVAEPANSTSSVRDLIVGVSKGDKLDLAGLFNKTGTQRGYISVIDEGYKGSPVEHWLKTIDKSAADAPATVGDNELHYEEKIEGNTLTLSFTFDADSRVGSSDFQSSELKIAAIDDSSLLAFLNGKPEEGNDYVIVDKIAPSITVSMEGGKTTFAKTNPGTAKVIFTSNEIIESLPQSAIEVVGGTVTDAERSQSNPREWTATFTPTSPTLTSGSIKVKGESYADLSGNEGAASNIQELVLNQVVPPTLKLEWVDATADGKMVFKLTSNQALTGLDATDFAGTGYTVDSVAPVTGSNSKEFLATITPSASGNISVALAAGAAQGLDAPTPAVATVPAAVEVIKAGSSAVEVNASSSAERLVVLSSNPDVVKLTGVSGTGSVYAGVLAGVSAGDKLDVSALIKTASGYTSAVEADLPDTGAGFVEVENLVLTKNATNNTTTVTFDITLDADNISGKRVEGFKFDLKYDYASVTGALSGVTSVSIASGESIPTWNPIQPNLRTTSSGGVVSISNGQIAGVLDQNYASDNPRLIDTTGFTDGSGKIVSVRLVIGSLVDAFRVGFDSQDAGGDTYLNVAGSTDKIYPTVGISKTAGVTGTTANVLTILEETVKVASDDNDSNLPGLSSPAGDNQLKVLEITEEGSDWGMLKFQYDTNPAKDGVLLSPVIEVDLVSTDLASFFNSDYAKLI